MGTDLCRNKAQETQDSGRDFLSHPPSPRLLRTGMRQIDAERIDMGTGRQNDSGTKLLGERPTAKTHTELKLNNQRQPKATEHNQTQPVLGIAVLVMWNVGAFHFGTN